MGLFTINKNQLSIFALSALLCLSFHLNGQNGISNRTASFENKSIKSFSKESNTLKLKTATENKHILKELSSVNKKNQYDEPANRAEIDVEIVELVSPNDVVDICGSASFDYIVKIKNLGDEVITSLTIDKYIDVVDVGASTFNNLSIGTNVEQVLYLGSYPKPNASFNIATYINSVNGENYFNSNGDLHSFHQYLPTTTLPYLQDYENYQLFAALYQESFYETDLFQWRVGDKSANCTGQLSAYFDNYSDTSVYGTFDGLLAPTIDFTNISNATLIFDYAYAQYTSASTAYNDSLIIAVATGCAPSTYYIIYEEGGADLATASPHTDVFEPTCNEWQSIQVDLSQYSGEEYVTVAIVNHSGYGNILWVDNLNIVETQTSNCGVSIIGSPEICNLNNGAASAIISNTTGNVNYLWSNGATTPTITGLNAGVYGVAITDGLGCTANSSVVINSSCNTNCSVLAASTPVSCSGNDGTATAIASNTVGSVSYLWSNGATTPIITGLSTGVYAVTITDGDGCTSSSSVNVNNGCNTNCSVSTSFTSTSCSGNDGTATAIASNTVGNVTYLWSNGSTLSTIFGLTSGVYAVSITDATGCTTTTSVNVTNGCNTNCDVNTSFTSVSCFGNDGTASAIPVNTVGNVSYLWNTGATTSTILGLNQGNYNVIITDATGCTATSSVTVDSICNTNCLVSVTATPVTCLVGDGTATAVVSNTVGTVSYLWNTGATTSTISGLNSGIYSVTITDMTGCTSTASALVNSGCNAACDVYISASQVTCNGNDGTATANPSNTVGNVTYLWNTGATTATISGLSEGNYSVVITDETFCTATSSIPIGTFCNSNCSVSTSSTPVSCNGNDGTATAIASNTSGQYSFLWSNGATTNTITGLSIGNYSVTITDAAGCSATSSVNITDNCNTSCFITQNSTGETCAGNDGIARAFAQNTVGNVSYLWNNGATTSVNTGLSAGVYSVTITDATGCTATANVMVGNNCNTNCTVNITSTSVSCNGNDGSATATASNTVGNVTYLWNTGATTSTITGLNTGNYNVVISDANGCTANSSVVVNNNCSTNCSVEIYSYTEEICGSSTGKAVARSINTTGDVDYLWSNGATSNGVFGVPAGIYTVTITDENNCSASDTIEITSIPNCVLDAAIVEQIIPSTALSTCNNTFDVVVKVKNLGTEPITSITLIRSIDGGDNGIGVTSNFTLMPGETKDFTGYNYPMPAPNTDFIFRTTIRAVNQEYLDDNTNNDTITTTHQVSSVASSSLPFLEDFESGTLASGLFQSSFTAADDLEWTIAAPSANCLGDSSIMFDNFNIVNGQNPENTRDGLITPIFDLADINDAVLSFDYAYAQYGANYTDSLYVVVSTNCGETYDHIIYANGGANLATADLHTEEFIPDCNEWQNIELDLSQFLGENTITIGIVNASDYGNNIWIDNINIEELTPPFHDLSINIEKPYNNSSWCFEEEYLLLVRAENLGTDTIKSYKFNMYLNSEFIYTSYPFIVNLAPGETYSAWYPLPDFPEGESDLQIDIEEMTTMNDVVIHEDDNLNNDTVTRTYWSLAPKPLPYFEDFESESLPTSDGLHQFGFETDDQNVWAIANESANCIGSNAVFFDNFSNSSVDNTNDALVLPALDFSNVNQVSLSFDYAYAEYLGVFGDLFDSLYVYVSTDCGVSFDHNVYSNGGSSLATVDSVSIQLIPECNQWDGIEVDLSQFAGESSITIAIVNASGYGNNIWVDNINVAEAPSNNCNITIGSTDETCLLNDGTANAFVSNATGSVNYLWSTGATTPTITGLSAGTYSVTITDVSGCTSTASVVVAFNCNTNCNLITTSTPVTCAGNDGAAYAIVTNTIGNVTYLWSNGATTPTISGLAAGVYTVTISDSIGCTQTASVSVIDICNQTCLVLTISSPTYCFGDVGTVTATAIGTVGPVDYLWSNGATTSTISGLSADTYSVTITDSLGCTSTSSAVVADNCNTACFVFTNSTPVTCEGNNGTATVTGGNVLLGYNILWSNGDTTQTISGLSPGTYSVTVVDGTGCIATSNVVVDYFCDTTCVTTTTNQTLSGCDGFEVVVGANIYSQTGVYTDALTSIDGCDSIVITNLTVEDRFTTNQTLSGCAGFSVTVGSNNYTQTGTYMDVLTSVNGCDSTVTTNLTIVDEFTTNQTVLGCLGFSITVGTNIYTTTGIYTDVLTSIGGCDSTVITNLTIVDELITNQTLSGCAGFFVTVGNNTYTQTGIYTDVLTSANGCDSTVITNLIIKDEFVISQTLTGCEDFEVIVGNNTYNQTGIYTDVLTSDGGCDSTVITNLTIVDEFTTTQFYMGCEGFEVIVGNNTYSETGMYTDVLTSSQGCDSTVITNLSIVDAFSTEHYFSGCDGYSVTVGNNTYTETGMYTDILTSSEGCDSMVTTNLTIVDEINTMQSFVECEGFSITVGDNTYNATGTYTDVLTSSQGCDSIVATNLTILESIQMEQTFSGCEGFEVTVGNNTYSETGAYTDVLTSSDGCDSTVVTNLTINNSFAQTQNFVECDGFAITVGQSTYTETGLYTDVFTASNGCDSIIVTDLTILENVTVLQSFEKCIGFSIQIGDNTYSETGTYIDVFDASNGCDSTVVTDLVIVEEYTMSQLYNACTGFNITVGNNSYNTTGIYIDTLLSTDGCDSIVTTQLNIQDQFETVLNLEECEGFSITVGDNTYSETGMYTDELIAQGGCDSIVITNLSILSPVSTSQTFNECAGFEITIGSNTYSESGLYIDTLIAVNGCDSIVTSDITIEGELDVSVNVDGNTISSNAQVFDFQWIDCLTGDIIQGFSGPSFTATVDGSYAVVINPSSSCPDTSECVEIATTGIFGETEASISVYPNPANNYLLIEVQEVLIKNIELLNDIGQVVETIIPTNNLTYVDVSELPKGIYILKFTTKIDNRLLFKKVIVN